MGVEALLRRYQLELKLELEMILDYWMKNTPDQQHGGFVGRIDEKNNRETGAPKGAVLNSRILWTFSAAYHQFPHPGYLSMADRAYDYISRHFMDPDFGGVYWTVDASGQPLDTKKQVYASAFTIYALAEYYKCNPAEEVLQKAESLFNVIEQHSFDPEHTGYIDAFARDWSVMQDIRLSAKDANEKKTMNTHLHLLEAYTNLYKVAPTGILKEKLSLLIRNFFDHFISKEDSHLHLFFDERWNLKPGPVSFGHDIEAAWLLLEAAEVLKEESLITLSKIYSISIAEAAKEGLDIDGGLWYEREPGNNHLVKEKHWWPQAEAMVGFYNAWQVSGDDNYLSLSIDSWDFVKKHIKDTAYGEWYWGVDSNSHPMKRQDKAGLWKCPYHNGRACLELLGRMINAEC